MSVSNAPADLAYVRSLIRDVPDFPKPGILFYDITPLLADPRGFALVCQHLAHRYRDKGIQKVIGVESRGLIFSGPVAIALDAGLVPARKPGKLPYEAIEEGYDLEYGSNRITMHVDAIERGERVVIVDDLIATGGTLEATCKLVERLGGELVEIATVIELTFLKGREKLPGRPIHSLLQL